MVKNVFKGMGIALVTPFTSDGEIDYRALELLVELQIAEGTDFLCVLGTTAETPCLSAEEKVKVKRFVVEKVAHRIPILLGCGGNNTSELVGEIKSADFTGIDGLLSVCPYYNKPSQEGLYQHFKAVAEATDLPIVLYNVPGRTGVNLQAETTLRLANDCENVVAIKEASGNISQIGDILKNKSVDFDVLSGDDAITYELLMMGAVGVISVAANALPKQFGEMVHAAIDKNSDKALEIHQKFNELFKLLSVDGNPAGIKSLLGVMKKCENRLRLPLVSARIQTEDAIKKALEVFE